VYIRGCCTHEGIDKKSNNEELIPGKEKEVERYSYTEYRKWKQEGGEQDNDI